MTFTETIFAIFYFILSKTLKRKRNFIVFASTNVKDVFGNLTELKKEAIKSNLQCRNIFGQLNTIKKAIRAAMLFSLADKVVYDAAYKYAYIINKSGGIKNYQIWHAAGAFKRFGMDSIDTTSKEQIEKQKRLHGHYDEVFVSSESVRSIYSRALNVSLEHVHATGLPRFIKLEEAMRNSIKWKRYLNFKYKITKEKKIILYCPTFREKGGKRDYKPILNLMEFVKKLPDEYMLAVKLHPRTPKTVIEKIFNIKDKRMVNWTGLPEDQALVCADFVVSDYSSVVFDAAYISKPVLYFIPDLITYSRGLYFDPSDEYPNSSFYDLNSLACLFEDQEKIKKIIEETNHLRERFVPQRNNPAKAILEIMLEA